MRIGATAMIKQLPLAIQLNDEATLANFCWEGNALLKQHVEHFISTDHERFIYVWGAYGVGKSHLLQACCQSVSLNQTAIYMPLTLLKEWGPNVLEGLEVHDIVCIDDVDIIAGQRDWEEALFYLYNRIRDTKEQSRLLLSGKGKPNDQGFLLPDLCSRFNWGLVLPLHELTDEQKIHVWQTRAQQRGFNLPLSVGQFLLNRCARNMHDLQDLLNRLDAASLSAQRKITIPFVKHALGI